MMTTGENSFSVNATDGMKRFRFIKVDPATNTGVYGTDETANAISVGDASPEYNNMIAVISAHDTTVSVWVEAGEDLITGDAVMAGANGVAVKVTDEDPLAYVVQSAKTGCYAEIRSAKCYA